MIRAVIFANGTFCPPFRPLEIQAEDLVIAADGGSQHCQALGLRPGLLIGDLDSIDPDLLAEWRSAGIEIREFPPDKDQTDLELALLAAQDLGAQEIQVYGAVGGRLDMTLGNLTLLAHPLLKVPVTLFCGREEFHLLRPGSSLTIQGHPGETVSLIPLQPGSSVVTARGMAYPLQRESLEFGYTRGISNQLTGREASVSLESGLLALVHTRREELR